MKFDVDKTQNFEEKATFIKQIMISTFFFQLVIMNLSEQVFEDQITIIGSYLDTYFKQKLPDCILYSQGLYGEIHLLKLD